jgi:hypothetical protein
MDFSDVNPPVHAWAVFRVFKIDEYLKGNPICNFWKVLFRNC